MVRKKSRKIYRRRKNGSSVTKFGDESLTKWGKEVLAKSKDVYEEAAREIVANIKSYIVSREAFATGKLVESISLRYIAINQYAFRWEVFADETIAPHAVYVEFGTIPNQSAMPPQEAIEEWVDAKGITPYTEGITQDQLVYLIRKHIYENGGITGISFMRSNMTEQEVAMIRGKFGLALRQITGKYKL